MMIAVGQTTLAHYDDLWDLITCCQPLLGDAESLMALAEHATDNRLDPWTELPWEPWVRGRVFGARGELQWRAYGPLLRIVLVAEGGRQDPEWEATDSTEVDHIERQMRDLGFADITTQSFVPGDEDEKVFLWRGPYSEAQVRRYRASDEPASFVRYCSVTQED